MNPATPAQLDALKLLSTVLPPGAYLAGGVAVAARIGHRQSHDLDIFVFEGSPETLALPLSQLGASVRVLSRTAGTLHAEISAVPISVLRYAYPLLEDAELLPNFALPVASTQDLICMKLSAIASRGAKRDFWDLHVLLENTKLDIAQALALYRRKYPVEDVGHVVRSLVYFGDADAEPTPPGLSEDAWSEIKASFIERVKCLD